MERSKSFVLVSFVVMVFAFVGRLTAQEKSSPEFTPKQAMNFFTGEWHGVGRFGNYEYQVRSKAEWDLHHTVTSHRIEFFSDGFAHTLAMTRWWDPQERKIVEHQFGSWGIYRKGEYELVPHGDWFHLVGTSEQTDEHNKRTHINIVTVHDDHHFTWTNIPSLGLDGNPATEHYSRPGVSAREDSRIGTADNLKEAISFLQNKPGFDTNELLVLKKALANLLLQQNQPVEAIAVVDGVLAKQKELLSAGHRDVASTTREITEACRIFAYGSCMDTQASEDRLEAALNVAKYAAKLMPDDQRIWLQAFAHHRLDDNTAAQQAMRESLSKDFAFANMLLLAAMIEQKAGDKEMAQVCYAMAMDFVEKWPTGGPKEWMNMAREAVGHDHDERSGKGSHPRPNFPGDVTQTAWRRDESTGAFRAGEGCYGK